MKIVPGEVIVLERPDQIWNKLVGKTVERIAWHHYAPVRIYCTDGTCFRLEASGQPPTIFPSVVS
jgi:hypothetical protein